MVANHVTNKALPSRIYKELLQLKSGHETNTSLYINISILKKRQRQGSFIVSALLQYFH